MVPQPDGLDPDIDVPRCSPAGTGRQWSGAELIRSRRSPAWRYDRSAASKSAQAFLRRGQVFDIGASFRMPRRPTWTKGRIYRLLRSSSMRLIASTASRSSSGLRGPLVGSEPLRFAAATCSA